MKIFPTRNKPSNPNKRAPVPLLAKGINTAIALVLLGLSIYHFTQPNQAWRSGTTELVCAVSLLTAAYLVPHVIAMVINLVVAVPVVGLGVRHFISTAGWRSGIAELFLAVLLIVVAYIVYKDRKKTLAVWLIYIFPLRPPGRFKVSSFNVFTLERQASQVYH